MKMRIFEMIRERKARMRENEKAQRRAALAARFAVEEKDGFIYITFDGVALSRFMNDSVGKVTALLDDTRKCAAEFAGLAEKEECL